MIKTLIKVGKPVIVASDKKKTPSKVQKIAKSVGAELYVPNKDLSQQKKKNLGMGANSHELDAVASAKNAYNNLQKEIGKIQTHTEETEFTEKEVAQKYFRENKLPRKNRKSQEEEDKESDRRTKSSKTQERDKEKERLETKIENLEEKIDSQQSEINNLKKEKTKYFQKYQDIREEKKKEILEKEELSRKEGAIKRKNKKIESLEEKLRKTKIRENQYRKAIKHVYAGSEILPILDKNTDLTEDIEKAVIRGSAKESFSERVKEVYLIDEIQGIELKDFFIVSNYPEPNYEEVIKRYKDSR